MSYIYSIRGWQHAFVLLVVLLAVNPTVCTAITNAACTALLPVLLILLQVYLPMSYIYGIRGTCKETPLTAAIRCVV
jgi:hypothetical protein